MPPPTAPETEAPTPPAAESALAWSRLRSFAGILEAPRVASAATALAVGGAVALLLARLVPDVRGKPLFDDEAVAGLTALHPLGDLLDIVISDRGGAPLHFILSHVALSLDASPEALRWLSLVFALATIPVCYDLGRRLGGRVAGATAAAVAATSSMLAVYGTVGRMYALFAFASALAADLFVRALERRTPRSIAAAAVAAWALPAVHPYGILVVAIEAAVALGVWRGRSARRVAPLLGLLGVLAVGLVPFVVADLRLSERFGVGVSERTSVAPPDFAADHLGEALAAFAGGSGWLAAVFFGLALAGLFTVARRNAAFAVFALAALAAVPILLVVVKAREELIHQLSPRHLMFGLPIWAALVGLGVARIFRDLPRGLAAAGVAAVALAAALAPSGIADPRVDAHTTPSALAAPAEWVRANVEDDDVLLFYSPLYLATLPETQDAIAIPRSGRPLAMLERADYPVPSIFIAFPLVGTPVDRAALGRRLGPASRLAVFSDWLVLRARGPFADERAVLLEARDALAAVRASTPRRTLAFSLDLRGAVLTVCDALAGLGSPCPERLAPPRR